MDLTTLISDWRTLALRGRDSIGSVAGNDYSQMATILALERCACELESALQEAGQPPTDWTKITRVEVIGPHGREHARRDITVQSSMQDNGRTLKLFIALRPASPVDRGRGDEPERTR